MTGSFDDFVIVLCVSGDAELKGKILGSLEGSPRRALERAITENKEQHSDYLVLKTGYFLERKLKKAIAEKHPISQERPKVIEEAKNSMNKASDKVLLEALPVDRSNQFIDVLLNGIGDADLTQRVLDLCSTKYGDYDGGELRRIVDFNNQFEVERIVPVCEEITRCIEVAEEVM